MESLSDHLWSETSISIMHLRAQQPETSELNSISPTHLNPQTWFYHLERFLILKRKNCETDLPVSLLHGFGLLLNRQAQGFCPFPQLFFQLFQGFTPCFFATSLFFPLQEIEADREFGCDAKQNKKIHWININIVIKNKSTCTFLNTHRTAANTLSPICVIV